MYIKYNCGTAKPYREKLHMAKQATKYLTLCFNKYSQIWWTEEC